jgi:hypothetical protein
MYKAIMRSRAPKESPATSRQNAPPNVHPGVGANVQGCPIGDVYNNISTASSPTSSPPGRISSFKFYESPTIRRQNIGCSAYPLMPTINK